jgi:PAS domain S-box-containing protein
MTFEEEKNKILNRLKSKSSIIIFAALLILVYLTYLYSFLLFHVIVELFSVVIAFGIFAIGWNSRKNIKNSLFVVLGISLLFIGSIDLIHTLAYKGMNIFEGYDANLPTQLWIGARYLQAGSFLIASLLIYKKVNPNHLVIGYTIIDIALVILIFTEIFPVCYIEGFGLTLFKIISEYLIIGILFGSIIVLYLRRKEFDKKMLNLLIFSILSTMLSELAFTFYVGVYDLSNVIGHFLKIIAFYLIYLSIIQKGLEDPINILFTKLKKSEESLKRSEKKFRLTFENASDAIFWADPNTGIIINCNHAAEKLLECKKEDIIGMHQREIHPPEKNEFYENMFKNHIAAQEVFSSEAEVLTKSGRIIPVTITASLIEISKQPILQGIFRDISERKKAEQNLKNLISTVSHELRTPITVLMMSLDLFKQRKNSMTNDLMSQIIDTSERNVSLLKDLSEDLILLSKIDAKKIELEISSYKPLDLLKEIEIFLAPFAQEKNVSFHINVDHSIHLKGDLRRIDQIFRIILDNAIKYSYPNTIIEISAIEDYKGKYNTRGIDGVLFQVKNNGQGIGKEDLPHIFERFYRASNVGEISGTGLGLAIAKDLIQLHLGEILVESELNKSTTIYIFFPRLNHV